MAGGKGTRLWPVSTERNPKQFHDIMGTGQTLLQRTYQRLRRCVPDENILILTNQLYKNLVVEQLPELAKENLVLEPEMRNTAPCILYAMMKIKKRNPESVVLVAPSDHWIENELAFERDIESCFDFCQENDALMTLGIVPTYANTGYGYIQHEKSDKEVKKVIRFTEKPDLKKAEEFVQQGDYLWNAGIFVWSISSILKAFEKYRKSMFALFQSELYNTEEEQEFISDIYPSVECISIDYALMEVSDNVFVFPAHFDWNDLGTWGALHEKLSKDANSNVYINAAVLFKNASNNLVHTEKDKIVIISEIDNYIVVDKNNVLMIYPKEKEQEIRGILSEIKQQLEIELE